MVVKFEGALWVLPKVAPKVEHSNDTEFFAVKVKRRPFSDWPDPTAVKLTKEQNIVCLPGPAHISSTITTIAKLRADHPEFFKDVPVGSFLPPPPPPSSSARLRAGPREATAAELDIEKEFTNMELMSLSWFRPEWMKKVRLPGKAETAVVPTPLYDAAGVVIGLQYSLRRKGDDSVPQDREVKPMPREAMIPGMQRALVNNHRKFAGHGPLAKPPPTRRTMAHF